MPFLNSRTSDEDARNVSIAYARNSSHIKGRSGNSNDHFRLHHLESAVDELVSRNPRITLPELAKELGVARSTVALRVSAPRGDGVIRRVGSHKSVRWEVIGKKR